MRTRTKIALMTSITGVFALGAQPANAVSALVGVNLAKAGPYSAPATCDGLVGAATSLNSITYVIKATANAVATNGGVGVGTSVQCRVVDTRTHAVYGGASGGLPGPMAVAVGTATVPLSATVAVQVCSGASFNNGGSFSSC